MRGRAAALVSSGFLLAACAGGYRPPPPNSIIPSFDARTNAVQVAISGLGPAVAAALVAPNGTRFPASGISVVRGPYVAYNPPPSIGIGIGGFGFSGCCSAFGSGIGVGVPVGAPTPAGGSDQWISSALIPIPANYHRDWSTYRVEVQIGASALMVPAPPPG